MSISPSIIISGNNKKPRRMVSIPSKNSLRFWRNGFILFILVVLLLTILPVVSADKMFSQNGSALSDLPQNTVLFVSSTSDKAPIFELWRKRIVEGLVEEKDTKIDLVVESLEEIMIILAKSLHT